MNPEQLRLDDALPLEGGGKPQPLKRWLAPEEVWWKPGSRFHCRELEPLRYDHVAGYVRFGSESEAVADGAVDLCQRCRRAKAPTVSPEDSDRGATEAT